MLIDRVIERCAELDSHVIVGIDPVLEKLPEELVTAARNTYGDTLAAAANAFLNFGCAVIDAVDGVSCIVKPQLAYFEVFGAAGVGAYAEIVRYAKLRGFFVIADAKRGDIGATSAAYARAFLGDSSLSADFVTVNPYLGSDCVNEFVKLVDERDKGIFVLVKTSNKSSAELQDLESGGRKIYEIVGERVNNLAQTRVGKYGYSSVGAVVGATYPSELGALRGAMSSSPFLVPGYGAQGGAAGDVAAAFDAEGRGAYVNSSRGIIYAREDGLQFADAIRNAAIRTRDDIRTVKTHF